MSNLKLCPVCEEYRTNVNREMCGHCESKKDLEENGFGATPSTLGDTCERFVIDALSGEDFESGKIEVMASTIDNLRLAMGRLIAGLYNSGVFTKKEIETIVRGY